jgi:predicted rRNA methylase YqxC with S4 and FtsJ domains
VVVNEQVISKAGHQVSPTAQVVLNAEEQRYVCRAGHKLERALQHFGIDVTGKVMLGARGRVDVRCWRHTQMGVRAAPVAC